MTLPGSSSSPAEYPSKQDECDRVGAAMRNLLELDLKPRDIMTRAAFENAMVLTMALGGSTNAVLHLIAIAHSVGIKLELDDIQSVSDRVPFLADLKPSGKYVMEDVNRIGGIPSGWQRASGCRARAKVVRPPLPRRHLLPHLQGPHDGRHHDRHWQDARRERRPLDDRVRQALEGAGRHPAHREPDEGDGAHSVGGARVGATRRARTDTILPCTASSRAILHPAGPSPRSPARRACASRASAARLTTRSRL